MLILFVGSFLTSPQTVSNWQRKGSFLGRWKKESSMSMTCVV